jgi:hypothetical protein
MCAVWSWNIPVGLPKLNRRLHEVCEPPVVHFSNKKYLLFLEYAKLNTNSRKFWTSIIYKIWGFHGGDYEEWCLTLYYELTVEKHSDKWIDKYITH